MAEIDEEIDFALEADDGDPDFGNGVESFNGDEVGGKLDMENLTPAANARLKSIVERVERLNEDKAAILADTKEVYGEAKGEGFDTKILRKIVAKRARDKAALAEEEAMMDLYEAALGMLG